MKNKICYILSFVSIFLIICCKKSAIIQVEDVREVDFVNNTGEIIYGKLVNEIMGARIIGAFDTLLFVVTNDPKGLLQVYSLNDTHRKLGTLCQQGRAQNEMSRLSLVQAYYKDDHCHLFIIDAGIRICELDITASLEKGSTVVCQSLMRPFSQLGSDVFINNDIGYMIDFMDAYDIQPYEEEQKRVPSKYTIIKDEKQKDLVFFRTPMRVSERGLVNYPYRGTLVKHPSRNIVVNKFSYMDYLLFMDFDHNHFFATHQIGSMTHEDTYEREEPWIQHFSACTVSENYFFIYYRNGIYSRIQQEGDVYYPELLVFNWDGNYLKGFKMDMNSSSIAFDEKNKILYTLSTKTEKIFAYDLSTILP